jgi:uncharacterized protein YjbJ (UPF0337 family)
MLPPTLRYSTSPNRLQVLADVSRSAGQLILTGYLIMRRGGIIMDKDRVEGKVKDIAGRAQRQVGEWTGDEEAQVKGAAKQVEGKVQNAWGQAKDAVKKSNKSEAEQDQADREEAERQRKRAANE